MPAFYHLLVLIPAFFFYYYASALKCFRTLLRRFPGFFTLGYISGKGPLRENMTETKFGFTLTGTGIDESPKDSTGSSNQDGANKSLTVKVSTYN